MSTTTVDPETLTTLTAAAEAALAARATEQERLDALSLKLEALLTEFRQTRQEGDAARAELRRVLLKHAPGHSDLGYRGMLSELQEHESRQLEDALREQGLDVSAALREPAGPELLEKWRAGGILSPHG